MDLSPSGILGYLKQRWTVPFSGRLAETPRNVGGLKMIVWSVLKLWPVQICFALKPKYVKRNRIPNFNSFGPFDSYVFLCSICFCIRQTSRASQSHLPAFATWRRSLDSFSAFDLQHVFSFGTFLSAFFRSASRMTRT